MKEQMIVSERLKYVCQQEGLAYYEFAYNAAVPITTVMHIINCSTKNPGIFTIIKVCNGLNVTIQEFFNSKEFIDIEYEPE